MPRRTYYDFILVVDDINFEEWNSRTKRRTFSVKVFDSPVGQQGEAEKVEIRDYEDLENKVCDLADRVFDGDLVEQQNLGKLLADYLLPEKYVRSFFYRSLKRLKQPSDGLRLWLRLKPQIADLPWEYLYLPKDQSYQGGFLALDPRLSIVRHEELPIPADWPEPRKELHIILAMASPKQYNPLPSLPKEQKSIIDALDNKINGLTLDCLPQRYTELNYPEGLPGTTLYCLKNELKHHTDILHFSGHGVFVARSGKELDTEEGKGYIVLAKANNQPCEVSAKELADIVENKGVRLLLLAACDTAKRLPFKDGEGFTFELLKHRIPCVLAMQFKVDDPSIATFSAAFYQTLAAGWTVDEAVSQGRAVMNNCNQKGKFSLRDWGAPVLYSRVPGGELFRPLLIEQARQEAEYMAEQRSRLLQIWWNWNETDDTLATIGQLRNLAKAADKIELSPYQILFLVRSSVAVWIPVSRWLDRICNGSDEINNWIKRLENPVDNLDDMPNLVSILDLDRLYPEECTKEDNRLACSAVINPDQLSRQTAVLTLSAGNPQDSLSLLSGSLKKFKKRYMDRVSGKRSWWQPIQRIGHWMSVPFRRWWRQSELYSTLVELDASRASYYNNAFPPTARIGMWGWRFWKRFVNNMGQILSQSLGAGLVAGFLLSLQRGLYHLDGGVRIGAPMSFSFFYALVLCMFMIFGMRLAEPLLLKSQTIAKKPPVLGQGSWLSNYYVEILTVLLGTFFFGTTHIAVAWINDFLGNSQYPTWLMIPAGYLLGIGLSIAVYGIPGDAKAHRAIKWIFRFTIVVLFSLLAQSVVFAMNQDFSGVTLTYTGGDIADLLGRWEIVRNWIDLHSKFVTLIDASLVGILLTLGIIVGLVITNHFYIQWQAAVHYAED
jgi:hypothetical protein